MAVATALRAVEEVRAQSDGPQGRGYNKSDSSSFNRLSNKRNVLSMGSDVLMSTPAVFNVSNGNLEPPERKKFRYASTLPDSRESTRCERATAAEIPVAYL